MMHGGGYELGAAQFEEAAMAETVARRPVEDIDGVAFRYPVAQDLARLVPVDEEDEDGADRREEIVAALASLAGQRPVTR